MKRLIALLLCLIICSTIQSKAAEVQKIAIVDVQKVFASSSQVQALKKAQENKAKEVVVLIKKAKADIDKQTTDEAKKKIKDNLDKQLAAKQETNVKEYTAKLKEIDKNISLQIEKQAAAMGYSVVLTNSAVLYGGDDITDAIIKAVK